MTFLDFTSECRLQLRSCSAHKRVAGVCFAADFGGAGGLIHCMRRRQADAHGTKNLNHAYNPIRLQFGTFGHVYRTSLAVYPKLLINCSWRSVDIH